MRDKAFDKVVTVRTVETDQFGLCVGVAARSGSLNPGERPSSAAAPLSGFRFHGLDALAGPLRVDVDAPNRHLIRQRFAGYATQNPKAAQRE